MRVGYARVSTQEQTLDSQTDALESAKCERVFTDKVSGVKANKPEFERMMSYLRKGDTIVIWKLDRLGNGGRPGGLSPKYQKIAPAVKNLYVSGEQSTTQIMSYFQIGSRRTLYKILRHAGVSIEPIERKRPEDQNPLE